MRSRADTCAARPTLRTAHASAANSCRREILAVMRRNALPYQMNGWRTSFCDQDSSPSPSLNWWTVRMIVARVR
nr:hypothetical protein [Solirubrobacter soli]